MKRKPLYILLLFIAISLGVVIISWVTIRGYILWSPEKAEARLVAQIGNLFGTDLTYEDVTIESKVSSGFMVDGDVLTMIKLAPGRIENLLHVIQEDKRWNRCPLPAQMYSERILEIGNVSLSSLREIVKIDENYWFYYNNHIHRHGKNHEGLKEYQFLSPHFTFSVLDLDDNILYFYEFKQ